MADIVVDGMTRASFVTTIANPAAPTVAELNAGTLLSTSTGLIAAGLEGFDAQPGEVDSTPLSSRSDTKQPGVSSYSSTALVMKKQTGTDSIFTTLTTFNTTGYIVLRRNVAVGTAWTIGDKVQVYPIATGDWDYLPPERNTLSRYRVQTPITDAPTKNAVVA